MQSSWHTMRRQCFVLLAFTTGVYLPCYYLSSDPLPAWVGPCPWRFGPLFRGEWTFTLFRGNLIIQRHAFLGLGRPQGRWVEFTSKESWEWYHQTDRAPLGWRGWRDGPDRIYGEPAIWYHVEASILWIPIWTFPLVGGGICMLSIACLRCMIRRKVGSRRRSQGRCASCGYDLLQVHGSKCPECGGERKFLPHGRT